LGVRLKITFAILMLAVWVVGACGPAVKPSEVPYPSPLKVLAVETFLAEIAQNVAGERVKVESLIPLGLDPHAFEPTPQDVRKIAESQVLILNGAGFEAWAQKTLDNAGGQRLVIEASAGLTSRKPAASELAHADEGGAEAGDPHFWLDPNNVFKYVENIREGLSTADPAGREVYAQNAAAYLAQLTELDGWIKTQVAQIPAERRLIVTNHESFGYFADRYGFKIIGTVVPSVSSGASPSAQELAGLIDQIKATGASAIFLETGVSPQLAEQVSAETGIKVISGLYSHSITEADGAAPTYLAMMKHNVNALVAALK
jgi:ABC-type Zn uptake system ZnuABC Zn-binding protein ZnuA